MRALRLPRRILVFALAVLAVGPGCGRPGDGADIPQPVYSWLDRNVFQAKCLGCHATGNAAYGVDLSSYARLQVTGSVVAGDPARSTLYTQAFSGLMPKGAARLSDAEIEAIEAWIRAGAEDDTAVVVPAAAPVVSAVTPVSGPKNGGTTITLSGTGFSSGIAVSVGGSDCTGVMVSSAGTLSCVTPAHGAGVVDITVTNPDGQTGSLAGAFTYNDVVLATPTIGSVSPGSGTTAGGTALTVDGANFEAGATVILGGASCTGVTVVSATRITCTTPAHAAGAVDVRVANVSGQSGTLASGFTYAVSATFSSIFQNILQPKCNSCHAGNGAPKGVDYSTYAKTMSTGSVLAGNAASSKLYLRTIDGTMPKNASPLSAAEETTIQTWINNGALND
ncbi:MAG: IPT/TIG domain-containing protein [Oligoflexia bacterium]|nr:IPT/TIG domain-containing protein [Oligoflexia bacterium]